MDVLTPKTPLVTALCLSVSIQVSFIGTVPSRNRTRRQFDYDERRRTLMQRGTVSFRLQAPANRCHSSDVITSASILLTIYSHVCFADG